MLGTQKTSPGFREVIQAWHKDRCVCVSGVFARMPVRHSGLMSMFVLDSECAIFCMFGHEAL